MKFNTKIASIALACAMAFTASSAGAVTQIIPLSGAGGSGSATFSITPGAGTFADLFLFNLPRSGFVTVKIESLMGTDSNGNPVWPTNVNFNSTYVQFNGTKLTALSTGVYELRMLVDKLVTPGQSVLDVRGNAAALGSYTGSITYAIPEPATWGMMILGFGLTGAALRSRSRRRKTALVAA